MTVHPQAATGFDRSAAAYERGRPGYPPEAVAWLVERLGLAPGRTLVDLAAGTGKLTRLLVPTGARVIAVEPVEGMRAQLEETVPEAEAMAGVAERMPLAEGSADAVTVAQAFHWFATDDALAEIARVLRPGGWLGLIWNVRDLDDPLQRTISEILLPFRGDVPSERDSNWRSVLERHALFGPIEEHHVPSAQELDGAALEDRFGSVSFIAALPDTQRTEVLGRVRALAGAGTVRLRYRTSVFASPLSETASAQAPA